MRALLLKDILTLRKTLMTYIGFMVLYFAIGLYSDNSAFFLVFVVLMCNMLPMNALAYDERFHWDRMGLCLPVPQHNLVLSKYVLSLLGFVVSSLPLFLFYRIAAQISGQPFSEEQQVILLLTASGLILASIQLPMLFWLGTERGRFVTIAIFLLFGISVPAIAIGLGPIESALAWLMTHLWVVLLIGLALFCLSALISIAIYSRKEFN